MSIFSRLPLSYRAQRAPPQLSCLTDSSEHGATTWCVLAPQRDSFLLHESFTVCCLMISLPSSSGLPSLSRPHRFCIWMYQGKNLPRRRNSHGLMLFLCFFLQLLASAPSDFERVGSGPSRGRKISMQVVFNVSSVL